MKMQQLLTPEPGSVAEAVQGTLVLPPQPATEPPAPEPEKKPKKARKPRKKKDK